MPEYTGFVSLASNKYVCADYGRGGLLVADRGWYREWERFVIVRLGDGPDIVALRSYNGKYVAVEMGGGKELTATRDHIGAWEKFQLNIIVPANLNDYGKFALKSLASGQWVCAEQGEGGILRANRDWIRGWEEFSFWGGFS